MLQIRLDDRIVSYIYVIIDTNEAAKSNINHNVESLSGAL